MKKTKSAKKREVRVWRFVHGTQGQTEQIATVQRKIRTRTFEAPIETGNATSERIGQVKVSTIVYCGVEYVVSKDPGGGYEIHLEASHESADA